MLLCLRHLLTTDVDNCCNFAKSYASTWAALLKPSLMPSPSPAAIRPLNSAMRLDSPNLTLRDLVIIETQVTVQRTQRLFLRLRSVLVEQAKAKKE